MTWLRKRGHSPHGSRSAVRRFDRRLRPCVRVTDREPDGYVPRSQLTEPPVLQAPVVIKEPAVQTPSFGMRTGILALYIDDEGRVLQVLGQEPALPAEYEQAAREAFLEARYTPGRIDGRAVKSRVRVEVKFNGAASPP